MFTTLQLLAMVASAIIAIGLPIVLLLLWRKLTHASFANAVCGAIIFVVFLGLEQIPHLLLLSPNGFIYQHTWAFVLYGIFAAGIFEETGRFVGFKLFLRKHNNRQDGVMYGIGHGGIESILLAGVTALSYIVLALQSNSGALVDPTGTVTAAVQSLVAAPPMTFLFIGLERISTICLHIALSVLVFQAAKRPGKLLLYPVAIVLHAVADIPAVLYQRGVIANLPLHELLLATITVVICVFAAVLYFRDRPQEGNAAPVEPVPAEPISTGSAANPVSSTAQPTQSEAPDAAPAQPVDSMASIQTDLSSVDTPIELTLDNSAKDASQNPQ